MPSDCWYRICHFLEGKQMRSLQKNDTLWKHKSLYPCIFLHRWHGRKAVIVVVIRFNPLSSSSNSQTDWMNSGIEKGQNLTLKRVRNVVTVDQINDIRLMAWTSRLEWQPRQTKKNHRHPSKTLHNHPALRSWWLPWFMDGFHDGTKDTCNNAAGTGKTLMLPERRERFFKHWGLMPPSWSHLWWNSLKKTINYYTQESRNF